jgi:oligopeptide/dipeptide ABC transporter ATP-binding protein
MENQLAIRNLGVDFRTPGGRVHALRDVSFDVPKGKILGIVGESGSGKSTVIWSVLRLLAGNAVVTGGHIDFAGRDVLAFNDAELRQFRGEEVSVIFQDPMTSQIPVLTYGQQMLDILYRRRNLSVVAKRKLAIEMMSRVGIADPESRIDAYPHHFSGGMRQRISIAMALMMDPFLLIADEPTTALDVTMEAQIMHLMRSLQAELQATLIVVSHNLGLIAQLCDEVVVMYAGEVVERGDVRQIFYNAQHPYTRALIECDPARVLERSRVLPTIPGDVPDLREPPVGCIFAPRCPKKFGMCASVAPPLYDAADGQLARCHLLHPERAIPTGRRRSTRSGSTSRRRRASMPAIRPLPRRPPMRRRQAHCCRCAICGSASAPPASSARRCAGSPIPMSTGCGVPVSRSGAAKRSASSARAVRARRRRRGRSSISSTFIPAPSSMRDAS